MNISYLDFSYNGHFYSGYITYILFKIKNETRSATSSLVLCFTNLSTTAMPLHSSSATMSYGSVVSCQDNDIMIIMITTAQSITMTISLGYRLIHHVHIAQSIIMYLATVTSLHLLLP